MLRAISVAEDICSILQCAQYAVWLYESITQYVLRGLEYIRAYLEDARVYSEYGRIYSEHTQSIFKAQKR